MNNTPNYKRVFLPDNGKPRVPLIIRPLELPRHTYRQVSLVLDNLWNGAIVDSTLLGTGRVTTLFRKQILPISYGD